MNTDTQLFIDGQWRAGGDEAPALNPATEERVGSYSVADTTDVG
jgi:acyl-CoA reductase-like NAD-dependent aldehyde dehydrogenase